MREESKARLSEAMNLSLENETLKKSMLEMSLVKARKPQMTNSSTMTIQKVVNNPYLEQTVEPVPKMNEGTKEKIRRNNL